MKNAKILLIDDNRKNLQLIEAVLEPDGFEILMAESGPEAFSLLEHLHPDLILLDIMMPEMSGFEVCEIIKQDPRLADIPIIFLTSLSNTESIEQAFELDAVDYISKPFNYSELLARVRTHLRLKFTQQKLSEANAAKDVFYSIIAHDLKSPFHQLLFYTDSLVKKYFQYDDQKRIGVAKSISRITRSSYSLLNNLLDWTRLNSGRMEAFPEYFDLSDLIHEVLKLNSMESEAKEIDVTSTVDKETTVYADRTMITVVVRNLISNAIKFTSQGGFVLLSANTTGDFVELSVADNGIGIPKDAVEKLFRSDVHYTTKGTNRERGSGLGLILCREFIARNSGKIRVDSEEGNGSTFTVSIPRHSDAELHSPADQAPQR